MNPDKPEENPTRPSLLDRLRGLAGTTGWQAGWREFHETYQPALLNYARRRGLSPWDADDVVQEVISAVARAIPSFRYRPGECRFKTWLFRITRNKVADHQRRTCRLSNRTAPGDPQTLVDIEDASMLRPDQEWEAAFEEGIRQAALEHVGRRVQPMTLRLYLYHVVDGHDVRSTVEHFRESGVTAAAVHLAKHRVQARIDRVVTRLRAGLPPGS